MKFLDVQEREHQKRVKSLKKIGEGAGNKNPFKRIMMRGNV